MCEVCSSSDGYTGENLEVKIEISSRNQYIEAYLLQDEDYGGVTLMINGSFMDLHIPVQHCPQCGRSLKDGLQ